MRVEAEDRELVSCGWMRLGHGWGGRKLWNEPRTSRERTDMKRFSLALLASAIWLNLKPWVFFCVGPSICDAKAFFRPAQFHRQQRQRSAKALGWRGSRTIRSGWVSLKVEFDVSSRRRAARDLPCLPPSINFAALSRRHLYGYPRSAELLPARPNVELARSWEPPELPSVLSRTSGLIARVGVERLPVDDFGGC